MHLRRNARDLGRRIGRAGGITVSGRPRAMQCRADQVGASGGDAAGLDVWRRIVRARRVAAVLHDFRLDDVPDARAGPRERRGARRLGGEGAPCAVLGGGVGDRADCQGLQAVARVGDASRVFCEIGGIVPTSSQVVGDAKEWGRALQRQVAGALHDEHIPFVTQLVDLGGPGRHIPRAAVAARVDRVIEDAGPARAVVKAFDGLAQGFGWEQLGRHCILGVEHTGVLNPERQLRCAVCRHVLAIQHGACDARTVAARCDFIADGCRGLAWQEAMGRSPVYAWLQ